MVGVGTCYLLEAEGDAILLEDGTELLLEGSPADITFNNFLAVMADSGMSVGDRIR